MNTIRSGHTTISTDGTDIVVERGSSRVEIPRHEWLAIVATLNDRGESSDRD
jgi:hypothetical protein